MKPLSSREKRQARFLNQQTFEREDWQKRTEEALRFAYFKEMQHRGVATQGMARDVVQSSLEKIISQQRFWDRRKYPTLRAFIISVVKSEFFNEARKLYNERDAKRSYVFEEEFTPNPSEALERLQFLSKYLPKLQKEHKELYDFFVACEEEGLFDGIPKSVIAEKLGMSRSQFSKKKKRLYEIVLFWGEELEEEPETINPTERKKGEWK